MTDLPVSVLVSLLRKGRNGREIMSILESITHQEVVEPTIDEIQF